MNKKLLLPVLVVFASLMGCKKEAPIDEKSKATTSKEVKSEKPIEASKAKEIDLKTEFKTKKVDLKNYANEYYALIDQLEIRKTPSLADNNITKISKDEKVTFLKLVSVEQVGVMIQGKKIEASFYKVKTKSGMEGWVFSGALTSIKPATLSFNLEKKKSRYTAFKKEAKDNIKLLNEIEEVNGSSKTLSKGKFYGSKANVLHSIIHGPERCSGGKIKTNFYDNGQVRHSGISYKVYYYGEYTKLKNGVHPNMKSKELVTLFGKPYRKTDDIYEYRVDHNIKRFYIQGYVYFFFKEGILTGIMMNIRNIC